MAEQFGVDETHVTDLLRFAGAYTESLVWIRMGMVRACYKGGLEDRIIAFEGD